MAVVALRARVVTWEGRAVKDRRGHTPNLIDFAAKLEQCKGCKDLCKRGEKWERVCPYPRQAVDRHATPVVVPQVAPLRGMYRGVTKPGG